MPKFVVDSVADGLITLSVPGTNYANTFVFKGSGVKAGDKVKGTIHAPAWKLDHVDLGGNYVEPLMGRPRRMQGTVLAANAATNELTVKVGYEVTVKLPARYKAETYLNQRVGWDNLEIPEFELQ